MTRIEVLFPEFCSLFADSSNIRYLEKYAAYAVYKIRF